MGAPGTPPAPGRSDPGRTGPARGSGGGTSGTSASSAVTNPSGTPGREQAGPTSTGCGRPARLAAATPNAASICAGRGRDGHNGRVIDDLIARMAAMLGPLEAGGDQRRYFHATYQRTTIAVADEIKRGGFDDPGWVERWDVAFADLYLDALETALTGQRPARPWEVAFSA